MIFLSFFLPADQLSGDILPVHALFCHDDFEMIEVIGDLIDDLVFTGIFCRYDDLCVFLSELFEHLVQAFVKEIVGIGAFPGVLFALDYGRIVFAEDIGCLTAAGSHFCGSGLLNLIEKAGVTAGVAGGADLDDSGQEGVHVAVSVERLE